jgi:deoxyribonuclease IV
VIFGAHCSTAGGVHKALQRAKTIGADTCQIFVKNNMQWLGRPHTAQELALYKSELAANSPTGMSALQNGAKSLKWVFGHTGYLINLGAPTSENRDRSIASLIQEIQLATALGLPFLVMHPGAHLGTGEEAATRQIIAGLDEVFAATRRSPVRIALENTAGQGSCLGHKMEHLAAVFDGVKKPERLGICLDTAHFFAAGYDIRAKKGWETAIGEVESRIGCEQILAFHLNDSKTDLGSRVDRHAHIGQGKIGKEGFRHIVNDARFALHPGCIETPKSDDLHEDVQNLKRLRELVKRATNR